MKGELKSIGQKLSQHRHLLIQVWLDVAWRRGQNIVAVRIRPSRPARDSARRKVVSGRHQPMQGETLGIKAIRTLHPDVSSRPSGSSGLIVATSNVSNIGRGRGDCANIALAATARS